MTLTNAIIYHQASVMGKCLTSFTFKQEDEFDLQMNLDVSNIELIYNIHYRWIKFYT